MSIFLNDLIIILYLFVTIVLEFIYITYTGIYDFSWLWCLSVILLCNLLWIYILDKANTSESNLSFINQILLSAT